VLAYFGHLRGVDSWCCGLHVAWVQKDDPAGGEDPESVQAIQRVLRRGPREQLPAGAPRGERHHCLFQNRKPTCKTPKNWDKCARLQSPRRRQDTYWNSARAQMIWNAQGRTAFPVPKTPIISSQLTWKKCTELWAFRSQLLLCLTIIKTVLLLTRHALICNNVRRFERAEYTLIHFKWGGRVNNHTIKTKEKKGTFFACNVLICITFC